jgi:hypothetical protein
MCKVKGCTRPMFVGGLCGFHGLERVWEARRKGRTAGERVVKGARPAQRTRTLRTTA